MTQTAYDIPDNPTDPEAAALDLIVRVPADMLGHDWPTRDTLQELAAILQAEGAFTGLSWHDAKHAAVAIIADAINRDDAVQFLLQRAQWASDGSDRMVWDDREAMARAFAVGAKVIGL
jgi:hypothetical protein